MKKLKFRSLTIDSKLSKEEAKQIIGGLEIIPFPPGNGGSTDPCDQLRECICGEGIGRIWVPRREKCPMKGQFYICVDTNDLPCNEIPTM